LSRGWQRPHESAIGVNHFDRRRTDAGAARHTGSESRAASKCKGSGPYAACRRQKKHCVAMLDDWKRAERILVAGISSAAFYRKRSSQRIRGSVSRRGSGDAPFFRSRLMTVIFFLRPLFSGLERPSATSLPSAFFSRILDTAVLLLRVVSGSAKARRLPRNKFHSSSRAKAGSSRRTDVFEERQRPMRKSGFLRLWFSTAVVEFTRQTFLQQELRDILKSRWRLQTSIMEPGVRERDCTCQFVLARHRLPPHR